MGVTHRSATRSPIGLFGDSEDLIGRWGLAVTSRGSGGVGFVTGYSYCQIGLSRCKNDNWIDEETNRIIQNEDLIITSIDCLFWLGRTF